MPSRARTSDIGEVGDEGDEVCRHVARGVRVRERDREAEREHEEARRQARGVSRVTGPGAQASDCRTAPVGDAGTAERSGGGALGHQAAAQVVDLGERPIGPDVVHEHLDGARGHDGRVAPCGASRAWPAHRPRHRRRPSPGRRRGAPRPRPRGGGTPGCRARPPRTARRRRRGAAGCRRPTAAGQRTAGSRAPRAEGPLGRVVEGAWSQGAIARTEREATCHIDCRWGPSVEGGEGCLQSRPWSWPTRCARTHPSASSPTSRWTTPPSPSSSSWLGSHRAAATGSPGTWR